jgi:hypothetical protein
MSLTVTKMVKRVATHVYQVISSQLPVMNPPHNRANVEDTLW